MFLKKTTKNSKPDSWGLGEVGTNTKVLVNQAGQVLAASRAKQEPATIFEKQALGAALAKGAAKYESVKDGLQQ